MFVAALHVVVILTIPWTTRWIPALVLIPIGYADLYAILLLVQAIERVAAGKRT